MASLAQRWNLTDPVFAYDDDLGFDLEWTFSNFIQDNNADFTIYDGDGCKEGSNEITSNMGAYLPYTGHEIIGPVDSSGDGFRKAKLHLEILPAGLPTSPILEYTVGSNAKVEFCVRYELWTNDENDPDRIEINFQETIITMYVDLTDGFKMLEDVSVKPNEKTEESASLKCEVEAFVCNKQNFPVNTGLL